MQTKDRLPADPDPDPHEEPAGPFQIVQLVKAEGGSTIQDVVQQVFVGDYERLGDAYLHPGEVFARVRLEHFTGREWLLEEVDAFLSRHDRGYFILEAEAGVGKTTFLAWLVKQRGYVHHFAGLAPGLEGVGRGLKNLAAQLALAYHLGTFEAEGVLPGAAARPDFLQKLLEQARERRKEGEKIVLVIDALDETGAYPGQNPLGLPAALPEGVYLIVSQRPATAGLQVDTASTPRRVFSLAAASAANLSDMESFLVRAADWPGVKRALEGSDYSPEQFTRILLEKCHGVWIYLYYVVHEIERGERSPLDLDELPDGMAQYYARYWRGWQEADLTQWYAADLPLLAGLAATQEPATAKRLADWAGLTLPLAQIQRRLRVDWRPFLAYDMQPGGDQQPGEARYRFYHATLREFFEGRVDRKNLPALEQAFLDELAEATREAHQRMAEGYLRAWGGLEAGLPGLQEPAVRDRDEGYGLRHLAAHLEMAGRPGDLHRLLRLETEIPPQPEGQPVWHGRRAKKVVPGPQRRSKNTWYAAKEAAGETGGFLADITRAWRLAESEYGTPARSPAENGLAIGLECRYALLTASFNSLAGNLPPALVVACVQQGVWNVGQGLAYARQSPDPRQRMEGLAGLAMLLEEADREPVLREALAAARQIDYAPLQAQAIAWLAPYLKGPLQAEAIAAGLEFTNPADRAVALAPVAKSLTEEQLRSTLTDISRIREKYQRAEALASLAEGLAEVQIRDTLEDLYRTREEDQRIKALESLAPYLPEPILKEALAAARKIAGPIAQIVAQAPLAGRPLESLVREAQAAARRTGFELSRTEVLVHLAPHLPEPRLEEALDAARKMDSDADQAALLAGLAPHLPEPLLKEALAIARQIEFEGHRMEALSGMAPHLPEGLLQEALAAAKEMRMEGPRADAVTRLADYLPEAEREAAFHYALTTALKMDYRNHQYWILNRLAPHLPRPLLEVALGDATEIGDESSRWRTLAELAPHLPDSLLEKGLAAVQRLPEEHDRVRLMAGLAPHLPEAHLEETLTAVLRVPAYAGRAGLLAQMAPHLPKPLLAKALAAAVRIRSADERAEALTGIGPFLSEPKRGQILQKALAAARQIPNARDRAKALGRLAQHLPEPTRERAWHEALEATWQIEYEFERWPALAQLAPQLPRSLLAETLEAVLRLEPESTRTWALEGLMPSLPKPLLDEALAAAEQMEDEVNREAVLSSLEPGRLKPYLQESLQELVWEDEAKERYFGMVRYAPRLATLPPDILHILWSEALPVLAGRSRKDLLLDFVVLLPVILSLGGQEAAAGLFLAIQDAGRWWS